MDNQDENLKILYDATDKFFQEMTFKMPERITNKAFKWLAVYTIALGGVPFFITKIWEKFVFRSCPNANGYSLVVLVLSALLLCTFAYAVISMLKVVHVIDIDAFDYEEPLEEVTDNADFPTGALLIALSLRMQDAARNNRERSTGRSQRMMNSYKAFYVAIYVAISVGLVIYITSLIY